MEPSTSKGFGQMLIDDDSIISLNRGMKMPEIPFYSAYTQPTYTPTRYVGPIEVKQIAGRAQHGMRLDLRTARAAVDELVLAQVQCRSPSRWEPGRQAGRQQQASLA